jgi:hypothetical protein
MRVSSRNRVSRIARRTVLNCDICVDLRKSAANDAARRKIRRASSRHPE